jgi:hypothetical protein
LATYPEAFTYRDDKGNTARVSVFVTDSTMALAATDMSNLSGLITPLTNAVLSTAKGPFTTVPAAVGYGANAEYEACEDKAVMTFVTTTGALHRYQIPAPKSALFLADGETIDPAQADVAAFVTGVVANKVSSRDGALITAFIGGVRARRKMNRRLNIYTKNPQLTTPAE